MCLMGFGRSYNDPWKFLCCSYFSEIVRHYFDSLMIMTFEQFSSSLSQSTPPDEISDLLKALWFEANNDWEAAHQIAQSREGTPKYDRLHAYLHRVEGDAFNAGYWYRRASAEIYKGTLKEEWAVLVKSLL